MLVPYRIVVGRVMVIGRASNVILKPCPHILILAALDRAVHFKIAGHARGMIPLMGATAIPAILSVFFGLSHFSFPFTTQ